MKDQDEVKGKVIMEESGGHKIVQNGNDDDDSNDDDEDDPNNDASTVLALYYFLLGEDIMDGFGVGAAIDEVINDPLPSIHLGIPPVTTVPSYPPIHHNTTKS